jgi:hypothetical protein
MPPQKGQSSKLEGKVLDAQGHIVMSDHAAELLEELAENFLVQIKTLRMRLDKANKKVVEIRKENDEEQ